MMLIWLACTELPAPYFCKDADGKYISKIDVGGGKFKPAPACNADAAHQGGQCALVTVHD